MQVNRYKVIIAYDGTDFCGWQQQDNGRSVAALLQDTFHEVFGHAVVVLGASRTDAGVHALGQVALVRTPLLIPSAKFIQAWSARLPRSIVIRSIELVSPEFHPFYNIAAKTYEYRIAIQRPLPADSRYVWQVSQSINKEKFENVFQLFEGTHDFAAFATDPQLHRDTICTLLKIVLHYDEKKQEYSIQFVGNRFLRHMIRRMVGAAVKIATTDLPVSIVTEVLAEKKPHKLFMTAPAQGLTLHEITYKI